MESSPSDRKLMCRFGSHSVAIELWFEKWSWFRVYVKLDSLGNEEKISTEEAVAWATKHLLRTHWKSELIFAERFPALCLLVTEGEKEYLFRAKDWDLLVYWFSVSCENEVSD